MIHDEGAPAIIALLPPSKPIIIDVEKSFVDAIAKYTRLEEAASSLKNDIAALPPQNILLRTEQLARMQEDLAQQDDQLIAILYLAGREVLHENFIKDYQEIVAKAILTFDQIGKEALLVKKKLSELIDKTQNS
jgi:hypothetical protein